jgi:pimeloyl-ACP methyl ester carboxylesterase
VSRVVAVGHSAGGHLALWAAARPRLAVGAPGRLGAASVVVTAAVGLGAVSDLTEAARARLGGGAAARLLGGAPARRDDATLAVLGGVGHFEPIDPTTSAWATAVGHVEALLV